MIDENIILKLSSGEEIVCRLVGDEHPRTFEITNPLMVSASKHDNQTTNKKTQ